MSDLKAKCTK